MRQWLRFSGATGPAWLQVNENFARCAVESPGESVLVLFHVKPALAKLSASGAYSIEITPISRAGREGPHAGKSDAPCRQRDATCGLKKVKASKTDQKRALFRTKMSENRAFYGCLSLISPPKTGTQLVQP
jgi:hypothetical protein